MEIDAYFPIVADILIQMRLEATVVHMAIHNRWQCHKQWDTIYQPIMWIAQQHMSHVALQ